MPGLALLNHDTANNGCGSNYPRSADQLCGQQSRAQLSPDEELTPEECLALYRKPVELYNIIRLRAKKNPPSLQRCLRYKIDAKRKKRIQISLSISGSANTELPAHGIFPLQVLFARATSNDSLDGHSSVYRFSQACLLTSFSESGDSDHTKATFTIPDLKSLATSQVCNHNIIIVSCGQHGQHLSENFSENHMEYSSKTLGGQCSWGKIPIDFLCSGRDNCATLSLGRTVKLTSQISMSPGFIEPTFLEHGSCLTFFSQKTDATGSYELRASIDAQEAGAKDMHLSPYSCYSYDDIPLSSLPHIIRLRTGNVLFNYKHCKRSLKSEVTEDFICSFCLVRCGSFKGLEYHLTSSHELFHFEFWVSEDCQAVNVSLKVDTRRVELLTTAGNDRSKRVFFYRSRFKKRCRRLETTIEKTKLVHPHILDKDARNGFEVDYVTNENGISVPQASIDSHPALHGTSHLTPSAIQFGKTTKLSVDRADPRNRLLLEKHKFFHSQKAQRMEPEEVLADHDSEDEIDDGIADFEDMTRLDGFSNVTKDEKRIMHMWNSFARRQRVLADGHIRWACDAFSRQHGQELVHNPALRWCWRLVMIKLWNHSLLDGRTMNACNKFLDDLESKSSDPKQT